MNKKLHWKKKEKQYQKNQVNTTEKVSGIDAFLFAGIVIKVVLINAGIAIIVFSINRL